VATRELWREGDKPRGYALEGALPKACVQSILSSCQPYTTCVKSMQSSLQLQAHLGLPFLEVHVVITKQHVPTSNVLFLPTAVVIHSALFVPSACTLRLSRKMCPTSTANDSLFNCSFHSLSSLRPICLHIAVIKRDVPYPIPTTTTNDSLCNCRSHSPSSLHPSCTLPSSTCRTSPPLELKETQIRARTPVRSPST
jgi:hypothetical protein